jgi:hypothetical protein
LTFYFLKLQGIKSSEICMLIQVECLFWTGIAETEIS